MPEATNQRLVRELERHAATLTDDVLAKLLENPFWEARYGERARRFGREDGRYHIQYLTEALAGEAPDVLERYATWLRAVLTARGMCSLHLAEHFRLLAGAIAVAIADGAPAVAYLDRAAAALAWTDGAAGALEAARGRLVDDVLGALSSRGRTADAPPRRDELLAQLPYLLSYLTDAVAVKQPARFVAYVRWLADFDVARGVAPSALDDVLVAVAAALRPAHGEAAALVDAARAALAGG